MLLHFSYLELSVEGVAIAVSGEDDIVHGWIICRDGGRRREAYYAAYRPVLY